MPKKLKPKLKPITKKSGPSADRLIITIDPKEALDRLLRKPGR